MDGWMDKLYICSTLLSTSGRMSWKHLLFVIASIILGTSTFSSMEPELRLLPILCISFAYHRCGWITGGQKKFTIIPHSYLSHCFAFSLLPKIKVTVGSHCFDGRSISSHNAPKWWIAVGFCRRSCFHFVRCLLCGEWLLSLSVAQSCDLEFGWASTIEGRDARVNPKWIYIVSHLPHGQPNIRQKSNIEELKRGTYPWAAPWTALLIKVNTFLICPPW